MLRWATVLTCAGLWLTETEPAFACDTAKCLLTPSVTALEASIWRKRCDEQEVDPQLYAETDQLRSPRHFMLGVCMFERWTREELRAEDKSLPEVALGAIDELQQAQSVALMGSQRMTAALFEGLLHCDQLDTLDPKAQSLEAAERRCYHRAASKASFARVDLAELDLRYQESPPAAAGSTSARTIEHVERMVSCQSTHLLQNEPACGGLLTLSDEQLAQVAGQVSSDVLPRYFDALPSTDADTSSKGKGLPPVTALLWSKVSETEQATKGSKEAFQKLRDKNEALRTTLQTLAPHFGNEGEGSIPVAVRALREVYGQALVTVHDYHSFVQRFISGLFRENGEDLKLKVEQNVVTTTETVARLEPLGTALGGLREDLVRLSSTEDRPDREALQRGCELLFCELFRAPRVRVCNACLSVDPKSPTRAAIEANNTLCRPAPSEQVVWQGATATSICREAGFDPATACGGLSQPESEGCTEVLANTAFKSGASDVY